MMKFSVACRLIVCATVAVMLSGCAGGEGAPKVAPKADVAGTVTLDGKPMDEPNGEIIFSIPGEAPVTLAVKGGKFEGKAAVGTARVEIRAFRQGKPIMMGDTPIEGSGKENYIADQFNDKSTLTAKISAGANKDLKFEVETKK